MVPYREEFEAWLKQVWEKMLKLEDIEHEDRFLEMGGSSILALRITNRINQKLNLNLSPSSLLQAFDFGSYASWLQTGFDPSIKRAFSEEKTGSAIVQASGDDFTHLDNVLDQFLPSSGEIATTDYIIDNYIFLLAAPFSGASLLRKHLRQTTSFLILPELYLLGFHSLNQRKKLVGEDVDRFMRENLVQVISTLEAVNRSEAIRVIEGYYQNDTSVAEIYRNIAEKAGKRIVVESTPLNTLSGLAISQIFQWFKDPAFIYLTRDPVAMILDFITSPSRMTIGDTGVIPYSVQAEHLWWKSAETCLTMLERCDQRRLHKLKLDEITRENQDWKERLSEFLNLVTKSSDSVSAEEIGTLERFQDHEQHPVNHPDSRQEEDYSLLSPVTVQLARDMGYQISDSEPSQSAPKPSSAIPSITSSVQSRLKSMSDKEIENLLSGNKGD